MKLRKLTFLFFLCLIISILEAQELDVKAIAGKELYRGDAPSKEIKAERNKKWENVSLSLLVQEVKAEAAKAGLESFDLSISDNAITIIYRDIRFLPNSSVLSPDTEEKIYKLTEILKRFSDMNLLVQGHTAKLSPDDTDDGLELSEDRARSVAGLISKTGLFDSEKIEAVGMGFYEPVADNATQEGRALNRRVEISIVGSVGQDSDTSMVWWELLSNSMLPGYTAYLVKDGNLESIKKSLEEGEITDLIIAETSAGVGIIDYRISFDDDGAPDSDSLHRMQKIGSLLLPIQPDTEVRIGGYEADLSIDEIEEVHFLTAYTLGAIAGFLPDNITFSASAYVLTKATAVLASCEFYTVDGTSVELKSDGFSFDATVPYSVDSLLIKLTTEDPLAKITGLSEDVVSLVPGSNEIIVTVESAAREQKVSQSYRLTVVRQEPAVTTLKELAVSATEGEALVLSPPFSSDITEYTVSVPYSVSSVSVTPVPADEAAQIDEEASLVQLSVGDNKFASVVADQQGNNPTEYTLIIERSAPLLSCLKIEPKGVEKGISLVPEFSSEIKDYRVEVPYEVTDIEVLPSLLPEDETAGAVARIEKDYAESLATGANIITVTLLDEASLPDAYTITIVRQEPAVTTLKELAVTAKGGNALALYPPFSSEISEYKVSVPYSVSSVSVHPLPADEAAQIDKEASLVQLSVGDNKFTSVVSDQLGNHPAEYIVIIERSAPLLSGLKIEPKGVEEEISLVPEFSPETTFYSLAVPYKTEKLKINAVLGDADVAAGASVDIISATEEELPVGTTSTTIRITDAEGKTYDYTVAITRNEKEKLTFDVFGISLIPGWYIAPSASFYTAGFGAKLNGGMTVRIAEDSTVNDVLRRVRIGLGGHFHGGAGNYLTILSGGGYFSTEYIIHTENFLPDQWYFPKSIIPRLETGAAYYGIDYTEGIYREGMSFYLSPSVRTDFIFPGLPNINFGIDLSYTVYMGPVTVTNFGLGASVSWE